MSEEPDLIACPYCGELIKAIAKKCRYCQEYLDEELRAQEYGPDRHSTTDRLMMPVDTPGTAIVAGYLGLFSLIPLVGLIAILVSALALKELRKNPDTAGWGRAYFGLGMGILFTLLYGGTILLAIVSDMSR